MVFSIRLFVADMSFSWVRSDNYRTDFMLYFVGVKVVMVLTRVIQLLSCILVKVVLDLCVYVCVRE